MIEPALTAEQWAKVKDWPSDRERIWPDVNGGLFDGPKPTFFGDDSDANIDVYGRPHAIAALCLYRQPFGFTQEDVEALANLDIADETFWAMDRESGTALARRIQSMRARIAALLPPKEPA